MINVLLRIILAFISGVLVGVWLGGISASAHGDAAWIQQDTLKEGAARCCGEQDCIQLPDGAVTKTDGGYILNGLFFPEVGTVDDFGRATFSSINQHYWGCFNNGDERDPRGHYGTYPGRNHVDLESKWSESIPRCLFAPAVGM